MRIQIVGLMPNENWFTSNRYVYDVKGIAPTQLARSGGGGTNALTKIFEVKYEDSESD